MNKHLYEYQVPSQRELKHIKLPWKLPESATDCIDKTFMSMASDNSLLQIYSRHRNEFMMRDMAKPAIRLYAYYILHPNQYNHNPLNMAPQMMQASKRALLSIVKSAKSETIPYIQMEPTFINRWSHIWLDELYESAEIALSLSSLEPK